MLHLVDKKERPYKVTVGNGQSLLEIFMSQGQLEDTVAEWLALGAFQNVVFTMADGITTAIITKE